MNKSVRLRKYQSAYELCISKIENLNTKTTYRAKSPTKSPREKPPRETKKSPKRTLPHGKPKSEKETNLNPYQLFVREQSQKNKYKSMSPKTRMTHISRAWAKKRGT